MKKLSIEEYCNEILEFYRNYKTEDNQLQRLIVRNLQDIKRKMKKEIEAMLVASEAEVKKQVTLEEYIKNYGYTIKEFDDCVGELCKKGVAKGCYQDYNLLQLVIGWLCNYNSEIEIGETR